MDALQRNSWQILALGGACAAVVVTVRACSTKDCQGRSSTVKEPTSKAPERRSPQPSAPAARPKSSTPAAVKTNSRSTPAVTSLSPIKNPDELGAWAASLKKRDSAELPLLLASTEALLDASPEHPALATCLKAFVPMVAGHNGADRVSALAVKAGAHQPEKALEVLNALFKDRKQRGGFVADDVVLDFAVAILRRSTQGGIERGTYQRACRLLDWLCVDPDNRDGLAARGGFEVLLDVMQTFHNDPGVLLEGCGCLQSLAEEPALNVPWSITLAMSCLQNFPDNGELQWRALAALHKLPLSSMELRLPIAKLACSAVAKHPRCVAVTTVVEWAAQLLHKLAEDSESEVRSWLKDPAQKDWWDKFRGAPSAAGGKVNKVAEFHVKELCRLCGVK